MRWLVGSFYKVPQTRRENIYLRAELSREGARGDGQVMARKAPGSGRLPAPPFQPRLQETLRSWPFMRLIGKVKGNFCDILATEVFVLGAISGLAGQATCSGPLLSRLQSNPN